MSKLLIHEPPLQVLPSLAVKIGLNEAIFVQQLHYIIHNNDSVGKWADGKKWYRDKPKDFAEKYFPFWSEGVVKRTIANLRNDDLIFARSDLNKIAEDRSLWYTVNYAKLDCLEQPVERITDIQETRRAASEIAKAKREENEGEGAKVQNELMDDAKVQNELMAKVQNEPIPKELPVPKDSITTTTTRTREEEAKLLLKECETLVKQHFFDPTRNADCSTDLKATIKTYGLSVVIDAIKLAVSPDRANGTPRSWGYVKGILENGGPYKPKEQKNGHNHQRRPKNSGGNHRQTKRESTYQGRADFQQQLARL